MEQMLVLEDSRPLHVEGFCVRPFCRYNSLMTYTVPVYQRTLDMRKSVIAVKSSFAFQVHPWPRILRTQLCPGLRDGTLSNELPKSYSAANSSTTSHSGDLCLSPIGVKRKDLGSQRDPDPHAEQRTQADKRAGAAAQATSPFHII